MVVLNIHFEKWNNLEWLQRIAELSIPVTFSFAPYTLTQGWYTDEILDFVGYILHEKNGRLGQQGLNHKCKHKHKFIDPWHENDCLYHPELSKVEQKQIMLKGKMILEQLFWKNVTVYVPPNHMFGKNTLEAAAEIGYEFFTDNAFVPIQPYIYGDMIVVPESKPNFAYHDRVYVHYDEMDVFADDLNYFIKKGIEDMSSVKPRKVDNLVIRTNRQMKYAYKVLRDLKNLPRNF